MVKVKGNKWFEYKVWQPTSNRGDGSMGHEDGGILEIALNNIGKEGWELVVGTYRPDYPEEKPKITFIFKREKVSKYV